MKDAVIVSTARTPIGKAYRGAFNNLESPTMASYAIRAAVERAGVDPAEIDDCVMGAAMQQGSQGFNVARQAAIRAELPVEVSGMTIDRQCSSGLMSIATAAKQVTVDGAPDRRRRWSRLHQPRAERALEHLPHSRSLDQGAQAGSPHADDRHGGGRRRALRRQP